MDTIDQAPIGDINHPTAARLIVFAALLLFAVMVGLMMYRWRTVQEPTAFLQIIGNDKYTGTLAEVLGPDGLPRTAKLSASNKYTTRFSLPPGEFKVRISDRNGHLLAESPLVLREAEGAVIDMTKLPDPPSFKDDVGTEPASTTQP
jgi:hypothetical protein